MATIIIQKNSGLTPASNLVNAGQQILTTGLSQLARGELSKIALGDLSVDAAELAKVRDKNFNSLELSIENSANGSNDKLTFIGAKIDIKKVHNVIVTPMSGVDGSVKELVSAKDYEISISGFIHIDSSAYPYDKIEAVNNFFSIKKTMQIVNQYCNLFKIDYAVFLEGDFNQSSQNHINILPFRFKLMSDRLEYGLVIKG